MTLARIPALVACATALVTLGVGAAPLHAQAAATTTTPAAAAPAATSKTPLPAARVILDRYVKAIGGRAALAGHSSMHQSGVLEFAGAGIKADVHVYAAKPNRMLTRLTIPGMGEIQRGFDGTTGWSIEPTSGPMVLSGKQLEQMKIESDFMGILHEPKSYSSAETVALTEFEGKPAYEVRLVRVSGDTSTEYFDRQSGLQVGAVRSTDSPMGRMTVTVLVADYKPLGGMLLPTRLTQRLATGQQMVTTLNVVEFDTVPAETFELPAQIKALSVAAPASSPSPAAPTKP